MPNRGFPPELLSQPAQARRDYFAAKVILHPQLQQVYQTTLASIQRAAQGTLVFVFGPTGVGKTTVRRKLAAQLIQATLPDLEPDPERIPVLEMEVPSPDSGRFDWRDYYQRSLAALQDVRIQYRLDPRVYAPGMGQDEDRHRPDGTRRELRLALETALRHRRPVAFLHDEAQHFKAVAGARQLLSQMDAIKSLASLTETILVLFGTYELLELTNLSGQLGRRSLDIHFPRYAPGATEFKNVLWTFQRYLPLAKEPDLVEQHEYFYDHTAGCVGVLKEWLTRALDQALSEEAETLVAAHLQQTALNPAKRLQMAREIQEGEAHALGEATPDAETEIKRLLRAGTPARSQKVASTTPLSALGKAGRPAGQRQRVGERRPGRDPVRAGGRAQLQPAGGD
jgi:energy-coupling factor transporter ATP-binding protein EcfA2